MAAPKKKPPIVLLLAGALLAAGLGFVLLRGGGGETETLGGPVYVYQDQAQGEAKPAPSKARRPASAPARGAGEVAGGQPRGADPAPSGTVGARPAPHAEQAVERRRGAAGASEAGEGGPPVRWTADATGIRGAMQDVKPELKECYEAWLKANPTLAGTLKVKFQIARADDPAAEDAVVKDIGVASSELQSPLLEGCLMNAMQGMRFEPPTGDPVKVTYPLRFSSPDAGLLDAG